MLKNSSRMKILLSLAMTLVYFPGISIAADLGNVCANITGNWTGDWRSRVRNFNCTWNVDAKAIKLGSKILFDVSLKNGRPLIFCKRAETFTLIGKCDNGKMTFDMDFANGSYLNGDLSNNCITLTGNNVSVKLNKKPIA